MSNKLEVMMNEILHKKFSKRIHSGYDPEDVDKFYDYIITYLKEVDSNCNRLYEELKKCQLENQDLKKQLEQKNNSINTLNNEINYLRKEGYDNQRQSNEMRHLREEIIKLKQNTKK
ncbi:MAG: DivIVA domain-containing protein [Mycoplasmataceae bacterium]|jgi:DivIVA domain-containing protein|nr:DivIVA domain-containing protein [Mycoplasmataceae bacterium]